MHFYSGWVGTLIASVALPFAWAPLPGWHWWAILCLMGFMGTVGHLFLILAYQRAPASTLTPYLYGQIGFAMLTGWVMFSQVPDLASLVGIGADRRLRRRRRLAHGARAQGADRAGGVVAGPGMSRPADRE